MNSFFRRVEEGFLLTKYNENAWSFVYVNDLKTWKGSIAVSELEKSAEEVQQDLNEFSTNMKAIFSSKTDKFILDFEDGPDSSKELAWKKVTSTGVKFSLGRVRLASSDQLEINNILENVGNLIADLNRDLILSKKQSNDAQVYSESLVSRLEKLASLKVQSESELFSKFALILNEKKAKIRALNRELLELKNENSEKEDGEIEEMAVISSPHLTEPSEIVEKSSKLDEFEDYIDYDFISKMPKRTKEPSVLEYSRKDLSMQPCTSSKSAYDNDTDNAMDAGDLIEDL